MKHSIVKIISFFIVFCFLLAFAIFVKADFIKVSTNGYTLLNKAVDYSCIYDSSTNLVWENPNPAFTYSWYSQKETPDKQGTYNQGKCPSISRCNTQARIEDLNLSRYCNRDTWRLPTRSELLSLIVCKDGHDTADWVKGYPCLNYKSNPTGVQIKSPELFTGMGKSDYVRNFYSYWTSETYDVLPNAAWFVNFSTGATDNNYKSNALYLIAVSNGNSIPDAINQPPIVKFKPNLPTWNQETKTLTIPEFEPNGLITYVKMKLDLVNDTFQILEYK